MAQKRKQYTAAFKAKVAVEALRGDRTINELATHYRVHPNQITQWRKQLLEQAADLFTRGHASHDEQTDALVGQLYQQIGQLSVELDWLKKRL
jgi:putative transposase